MLVYLSDHGPAVPPWLEGYRPAVEPGAMLCQRETPRGHLVGLGDPLTFHSPPAEAFVPIGGGWSVARSPARGDANPLRYRRRPTWCAHELVEDLAGVVWPTPVVLSRTGARAFRVAYGGPDFLPVLTPEQARVEEIARAARADLEAGGEADMSVACRWAAVLLAVANPIPPEAFAALAIPDDALVTAVLKHATGLPLKVWRSGDKPRDDQPAEG